MARNIKFSGREASILRAIGFGLGVTGAELQERVQMDTQDLVDVVNSLIDIGYVEAASMIQSVTPEGFTKETFEVNPSFANDLKAAMRRV